MDIVLSLLQFIAGGGPVASLALLLLGATLIVLAVWRGFDASIGDASERERAVTQVVVITPFGIVLLAAAAYVTLLLL